MFRKFCSRYVCSCFISVLAIAMFSSFAKAAPVTFTVTVSDVGDALFQVDWPLAEKYSEMKKNADPLYLARSLSDVSAWHGVEQMKGEFVDSLQSFKASMTQRSYATVARPGKWQIDMRGEDMSLINISENVATFGSALVSGQDAVSVIARLVLPEGSSRIHFDEAAQRLTYDCVPQLATNADGDVEVLLDAKEKVMSSLAKVYGEEDFDSFWVARTQVLNSSNHTLQNLRIRHRVAGLSSWSGWKKHRIVYPGQTVVEPFFPVFDVEELSKFTDTRVAMVEVEYRYEIDGKTVTDSDSRKIKVLSRNEALWASRRPEDRLDWTDHYDNTPMVISAFCNSNDPVVQEIAGAVSRINGGIPQASDEGAIGFLRAFWRFLEMNRVAYQSPAVGADAFDRNLQHVKYPRDVIRNRAGTCVDLAILWASVAKAVGLQAYVLVVPQHAFPVVRLPSGELCPIESTLILHQDFETARQSGIKSYRIADGQLTTDTNGNPIAHAGKVIDSDINAMQSKGVHCLDLPLVADGYLLRLGYKIELPSTNRDSSRSADDSAQENRQSDSDERLEEIRQVSKLVGKWVRDGDSGENFIHLHSNGTVTIAASGKPKLDGTWTADRSTIETSFGDKLPYELQDDNKLVLSINRDHVVFHRVATERLQPDFEHRGATG
ncbi:MAG: hypothetical protein KDB27_35320, partial [Planctomycetales bacterium]|nr:hypothetical protein [Planctomycetales bacterium]